MTPRFPADISIPLIHPRSDKGYTLIRADALPDTREIRADLTSACNEPLIYGWLFRERCEGRPYDEMNASSFMVWMHRGWQERAFFVFALLSPCGRLVGVLDIKSAEVEGAEVGYWLSQRHSGLMTLALSELQVLAGQAGFRSLSARVRPGNERSLAVVRRAGWKDTGLEWPVNICASSGKVKKPQPRPGSLVPEAHSAEMRASAFSSLRVILP
ncbi:GNAT family N-acetyltransferase [Deinococcus sp.]|uniref:GNAT family N-acetyltransferase n=1 Tax=Deinococcus sp. TaxID=47478 RepID=UPI003C7DCE3E